MNAVECKEWAKSFKLSYVRSLDTLEAMTIRQLKALVPQINKQLGLVICKAKFGKSYSYMTKAELVAAIWEVRSLQMECPKTSNWEFKKLSPKVFAQQAENIPWVHYVGFMSQEEATIFHRDSLIYGECSLASLRPSERLKEFGFKWEVKLWHWDSDAVLAEVSKDKPPVVTSSVAVADKVVVVADEYWTANTGTVTGLTKDKVWVAMEGQENSGKMLFKETQLKKENELSIDVLQSMLDMHLGKKMEPTIKQFILNRGFDILEDKVIGF